MSPVEAKRPAALELVKRPRDYIDCMELATTLALFPLMEDRSRLSLGDRVKVEQPSEYTYKFFWEINTLGVVRKLWGESRKELDVLGKIICKAMSWFPQKDNEVTAQFFQYVQSGLIAFGEKSYKKSELIKAAFESWHKLIENDEKEVPKELVNEEVDEIVKSIWQIQHLNIINLFLELGNSPNERTKAVEGIKVILKDNREKLEGLTVKEQSGPIQFLYHLVGADS